MASPIVMSGPTRIENSVVFVTEQPVLPQMSFAIKTSAIAAITVRMIPRVKIKSFET